MTGAMGVPRKRHRALTVVVLTETREKKMVDTLDQYQAGAHFACYEQIATAQHRTISASVCTRPHHGNGWHSWFDAVGLY
jgi:iron uptake system EfeUOB component EfeO/EfeM